MLFIGLLMLTAMADGARKKYGKKSKPKKKHVYSGNTGWGNYDNNHDSWNYDDKWRSDKWGHYDDSWKQADKSDEYDFSCGCTEADGLNVFEFDGRCYATLLDALRTDATTTAAVANCDAGTYLPLRAGFEIAPAGASTRAVVVGGNWQALDLVYNFLGATEDSIDISYSRTATPLGTPPPDECQSGSGCFIEQDPMESNNYRVQACQGDTTAAGLLAPDILIVKQCYQGGIPALTTTADKWA